jgi:hypothetical protein
VTPDQASIQRPLARDSCNSDGPQPRTFTPCRAVSPIALTPAGVRFMLSARAAGRVANLRLDSSWRTSIMGHVPLIRGVAPVAVLLALSIPMAWASGAVQAGAAGDVRPQSLTDLKETPTPGTDRSVPAGPDLVRQGPEPPCLCPAQAEGRRLLLQQGSPVGPARVARGRCAVSDPGRAVSQLQRVAGDLLAPLAQEYAMAGPMMRELAKWGLEGKLKAAVEREDHAEQTIDLGAWRKPTPSRSARRWWRNWGRASLS